MPRSSRRRADASPHDLILIGAGHSHVQVLRAFAMDPPPNVRLTLIVDQPVAVYSGMVPGFVAGQYRAPELEIDAVPLARRARARVVLSPAVRIDAAKRRVHAAGRPPLRYDLASIDIGSTVAGRDLPGIREHAVPTRPIGRFLARVEDLLAELRQRREACPARLLVVGGGAGGVELAFALEHRLRQEEIPAEVRLVTSGERLLGEYADGLVERVEKNARQRGIEILTGCKVSSADADRAYLDDGSSLPCDFLVWVTGAVAHGILRDSGLPVDERGFVRVRSTLQVEGHDDLLAVGDCASLIEYPQTPKAGVYAVRQGPYLTDNLRALLEGRELRRYRPQSDFLTLLNLGDGRAIGTKKGFSFEGRWVLRLKDWIDRRFMRRFQVLEDGGGESEEYRRLAEKMPEMEMLCGGCAAKVGQTVLQRALARLEPPAADESVFLGLARPDDAAGYRTRGGDAVVVTVDAFKAFTDDPYLVGRIGAVNAVSDLYATGVEPRRALAIVAVPEDETGEAAEETLYQVLAGARSILDRLGVTLLGGHTTTAAALMVGFTVEGEPKSTADLLTVDRLAPGQVLILTKALGTGVLFHADMKGLAAGRCIETALASMERTGEVALRVARQCGATAMTDVTGFGLAGHLGEMLRASGVSAEIDVASLPVLPGVAGLLARGERSTFHEENARARRGLKIEREAASDPRVELLFDPQTAGGLLFGVPEERAVEAVERLRKAGETEAAVIGRVVEAGELEAGEPAFRVVKAPSTGNRRAH